MTEKEIIDLIHKEVVLATGCTEPAAVALAATKARELLGCMPEKIEILLSPNVLKNAMGVGIPGTGMIGLPIAVAIGIVGGDSEKSLEVLTVDSSVVEKGKEWLKQDRLSIQVKHTNEKLYIKCTCRAGEHYSKVVIAKQHSQFVYLEKDNTILLNEMQDADDTHSSEPDIDLSVRKIYDFATQTPIEKIRFILETAKYNSAISQEGLKGYGLHTGKIVMEDAGESIVQKIIARTAAASDARMNGATMPVYTNSGSGNQGITCTLPVYEYALSLHKSEDETIRSLVMSHLMSIYIRRGIGRLSALCGIVNASMAVSFAITHLRGGSFEQCCYAIKNTINNISGMICDGAKLSCAMKISTGIYTAFLSSELAMHDKVVHETDGISEKDVDRSIANLARIGACGMNETDKVILDILVNKQN